MTTQLVKIPKVIAEWIEAEKKQYSQWTDAAKGDFIIRCSHDLFRYGESGNPWDFEINDTIEAYTVNHPYEFIRAIMDGYQIED